MLHACNAVDETGRKRYPTLGVGTRFRTALRDSLDIYGVMATPGVDLEKTRFPVGVRSDLLPDKRPDIADVLYGIHRWLHGHADESSVEFEVSPYVNASAALRIANDGKIQLPKSAILGCWPLPCLRRRTRARSFPRTISSAGMTTCSSSVFGGGGKTISAKSSTSTGHRWSPSTSATCGMAGRQLGNPGRLSPRRAGLDCPAPQPAVSACIVAGLAVSVSGPDRRRRRLRGGYLAERGRRRR